MDVTVREKVTVTSQSRLDDKDTNPNSVVDLDNKGDKAKGPEDLITSKRNRQTNKLFSKTQQKNHT